MPPMSDKKRKERELAAPEAWLVRVSSGSTKKSKEASPCPVYMVLAHGSEEDPSHSVVEVTAGAVVRLLQVNNSRGMSFAAMWTPHGPRIVGAGLKRTTFYDPKTSTELSGPPTGFHKMNPVLISDGSKLYALSRNPAVVVGLDFLPWFLVLENIKHSIWGVLPPPPIFPCRLNPLEYRNPPKVCVAAYAVVDSHILLSVQQDKGTCAFDLHANQWEMVHDKNLPFTGQAVPLGDHRFVACSKENGGAAAVYSMEVKTSVAVAGKKELSVHELHGVYKRGIIPGHLLCAMGKGSFSSLDVRFTASPAKKDRARIVHRTYSLVEGGEDDAQAGLGSGVVVKQDRQIYKLRDPHECLAQPSRVVAVLTLEDDQSSF